YRSNAAARQPRTRRPGVRAKTASDWTPPRSILVESSRVFLLVLERRQKHLAAVSQTSAPQPTTAPPSLSFSSAEEFSRRLSRLLGESRYFPRTNGQSPIFSVL